MIYPTDLRANGVGYALGVACCARSAISCSAVALTKGWNCPPVTFFYVTAIGPLLCAGSCVVLLNVLRRTMGETDTTAVPTSASPA